MINSRNLIYTNILDLTKPAWVSVKLLFENFAVAAIPLSLLEANVHWWLCKSCAVDFPQAVRPTAISNTVITAIIYLRYFFINMPSIIQVSCYRLLLAPLFDYLYLKLSLNRCLGCPVVAPLLSETSCLRLLFEQSPLILLSIFLLYS